MAFCFETITVNDESLQKCGMMDHKLLHIFLTKDKLKEFEKNLAVERKTRLLERKQKRKEERRQKWILEKEEEAQRIKDEKLKLGKLKLRLKAEEMTKAW